jgi:hypothetical protein
LAKTAGRTTFKAFSSPLPLIFPRAHAWPNDLLSGRYSSIDELAGAAQLHSKVILAPEITDSIVTSNASFQLSDLRDVAALDWNQQLSTLIPGATKNAAFKIRAPFPKKFGYFDRKNAQVTVTSAVCFVMRRGASHRVPVRMISLTFLRSEAAPLFTW